MSIERDDGQICLSCDNCSETTDMYDRDEFSAMLADAKRDGWFTEKDADGNWCNYCPACVEKEIQR